MRAPRIALALLLSYGIGLGTAPAQQDTLDLLHQVSKTYTSMKTLQADAEVVMGAIAPGMQQNTTMLFRLTVAPPDRMRIENKGPASMLMVFDGQTGWLYMPLLNKYTKIPAATPAGNASAASAVPGMGFIPDFKTIADGIQDAKILRSETLQLDGADTDCYVIEVVHKPTQPAATAQSGQTSAATAEPVRETVWVDKARLLIVRLSSHQFPAAGKDGADAEEIKSTITFDKLTLDGPVADDAFVFTPPQGATELDLSQFMPQTDTPAPAASSGP